MVNYKESSMIFEIQGVAWRQGNRKTYQKMMKVRTGIILQMVAVHCVIAVHQSGLLL